jgi:hypothetical protein
MEVWTGKWVARVRNVTSLPSSLTRAKQAALDLYDSRKSGEPKDWIKELNQTVANEIDRAYWTGEKRKWPFDLMCGQRHRFKWSVFAVDPKLRKTILDTEHVLKDEPAINALKGDDITLEYHEDGCPKLPACLDRRPLSALAQAA